MSDNNPSPNKKHRKKKRRKKRNWNETHSINGTNSIHQQNTNTSSHSEVTITETCTTNIKVTVHSRDSSHQSSSSTSCFSFPSSVTIHRVSPSSATSLQDFKPTTSAHNLSAFSTSARPPKKHQGTSVDSKTSSDNAVAGPSTQSSGHRTLSLSSTAAAPTKFLAIDCEMVGAGPKGHISQLARCSIVSYNGDVIYDKFIRPPVPVTDYRTRWSGIRRSDLKWAMPYDSARKEILKLLMGKVLVGHAIHNDLKVLNYNPPKAQIRDTSRIPLLNAKAGFPEKQPASLKRLTKAIFNRDIQTGSKGHSSVEDAKATMELYKLVEVEWERKLAAKDERRGENK
ncbi:hypothetical protein WMY93_026571 [Mugilogobius chulae]|uniref:Exonuclease domain-containing protein n=1 Tax=Mugilogobius chulae TaxID=88201 RepID=A0AAW0N279_9GOBI